MPNSVTNRAEAPGSKLRKRSANLVILLGSLVVALLLAEAGFRVYAMSGTATATRLAAWDPYKVLVEPHGYRGYRQKPNSTFRYYNGTFASTNALGFRGPVVSIPKDPSVFRILLLGGSATHGWGVNDNETIDAYMRDLLRVRYPNRTIDVVNLAFDGYDSYQLLERLRSDAIQLQPDLIIVNTGINDVRNFRYDNLEDGDRRTLLWESTLKRIRKERELNRRTLWTRMKHVFYIARLPGILKQAMRTGKDKSIEKASENSFSTDAAEYFERNLRAIAEEAAELCVPLILSVAPSALESKYRPEERRAISYWLTNARVTQAYRDTLSRRMAELTRELGSSGAEVTFLSHNLEPSLFIDDAHLTSDGNRALALAFVGASAPFIEANRPGHASCGSDVYAGGQRRPIDALNRNHAW